MSMSCVDSAQISKSTINCFCTFTFLMTPLLCVGRYVSLVCHSRPHFMSFIYAVIIVHAWVYEPLAFKVVTSSNGLLGQLHPWWSLLFWFKGLPDNISCVIIRDIDQWGVYKCSLFILLCLSEIWEYNNNRIIIIMSFLTQVLQKMQFWCYTDIHLISHWKPCRVNVNIAQLLSSFTIILSVPTNFWVMSSHFVRESALHFCWMYNLNCVIDVSVIASNRLSIMQIGKKNMVHIPMFVNSFATAGRWQRLARISLSVRKAEIWIAQHRARQQYRPRY